MINITNMKKKLFITDPEKFIGNKYYDVMYTALNKQGEDILDRVEKESDIGDIIKKENISFQSVLKWALVEKYEGAREQSLKDIENHLLKI